MIIRVTISNNLEKKRVTLDDSTTLRQAFEQNGVEYASGMPTLDGSPLKPGELDKTFADFGIAEQCFLRSVVKADNA